MYAWFCAVRRSKVPHIPTRDDSEQATVYFCGVSSLPFREGQRAWQVHNNLGFRAKKFRV